MAGTSHTFRTKPTQETLIAANHKDPCSLLN